MFGLQYGSRACGAHDGSLARSRRFRRRVSHAQNWQTFRAGLAASIGAGIGRASRRRCPRRLAAARGSPLLARHLRLDDDRQSARHTMPFLVPVPGRMPSGSRPIRVIVLIGFGIAWVRRDTWPRLLRPCSNRLGCLFVLRRGSQPQVGRAGDAEALQL